MTSSMASSERVREGLGRGAEVRLGAFREGLRIGSGIGSGIGLGIGLERELERDSEDRGSDSSATSSNHHRSGTGGGRPAHSRRASTGMSHAGE